MIFIDASYIIAIILEKDQWHSRIDDIEEKINNREKITSDMMIAEAIATVGSLKGGKIAKTMYDYIKDNYSIYETNLKSLDEGMTTLLKYDGTLSLADATSIEVMKKLKIHEIASFDSDFDNKEGIVRIH
jgi:predicted nucleic acid-binding protein